MTGTIKRTFEPKGWQIAPFRDKSFILLLEGSAGGGKSYVAASKIDAFCRKYANATALMVRKTRESMTNSTILFMERMIIGDDPDVKHLPHKRRFEYANGSVLAYGGMKDDAQREAIRSIGLDGGLDIAWMEEAHLFKLADFEELLPRMRGKAADWRQIIITTNPDSDQHWIYKRLIQGGRAKVYRSSAADNDSNPADYDEAVLGQLTGVRRLRLKEGKWVGAEGAVYEEYRYETHVIEPFTIPAGWRRFRAIDFGYRNPFVCQWWAVDGDGRLYLYRELYRTGRIVADHAEEIKRLSAGETFEFTVADHDAEDRATLAAAGIRTIAAKKEVMPGIEAVQKRLRVDGDGRARIFFFNDALVGADDTLIDKKKPTCLIDEITAYAWVKSADGRAIKEQPVKEDDHAMDCMRYAVMAMESSRVVKASANPLFD